MCVQIMRRVQSCPQRTSSRLSHTCLFFVWPCTCSASLCLFVLGKIRQVTEHVKITQSRHTFNQDKHIKFDAVGKLVFLFSPFLRQEQDHFVLNGTSLRRSGTQTFFLFLFASEGRATAHALWQVRPLCTQDWTSDHSHSQIHLPMTWLVLPNPNCCFSWQWQEGP